ncbi:MAG TPA: MFS transporter [Actinomycetota bacterium]|nr:MFS transporter [Actinomycetota bacterium]
MPETLYPHPPPPGPPPGGDDAIPLGPIVRRLASLRVFRALRIRDFRKLWTAMSVSLFGDGIYYVALAWQVYELDDAPSALAAVGVATSLPLVLFVLVGGVLTDRLDRRKVLIASDVIRGIAVTAIGVLSLTGALELWHMVVLVALYGIGDSLFGPAFSAIVPDLVPKDLLVQANSLDFLMRPLTLRLVGPALGGFLISVFGVGTAFLVDAATFAFGSLVVATIPARPLRREGRPTWKNALIDLKEGVRFARSHVWLWGTLLAAAAGLLAYMGPLEVLVPHIVKYDLGGGADDLGWVYAAGGTGGVVSSLYMARRGLPRRHMTFMYAAWTIAVGILAAYAFVTTIWQTMLVAFFESAAISAGMIVWMTLMHNLVPKELMGRVSGLDWQISVCLVPASFALTGWVAEHVGVDTTLTWGGAFAAFVTVAFLFLPGMRDTERDGSLAGATLEEEPVVSSGAPAEAATRA